MNTKSKYYLLFILIILVLLISFYLYFIKFKVSHLSVNTKLIKQVLTPKDLILLDKCSEIISPVNLLKLDEVLFYTNTPWRIINGNFNYIYDTLQDDYFLIEPGYFYYINCLINKIENNEIEITLTNKSIELRLFDFSKYPSKIKYL